MKIRHDVTIYYHPTRKRWLLRWWGRYDPKTEKQKYYCKSFPTKKQAERYQAKLKFDIEPVELGDSTISLQSLCTKFLQAFALEHANNTTLIYQETVNRLLDYFPPNTLVHRIKNQDARAFIKSIMMKRKGIDLQDPTIPVSDSTRHQMLRSAKRLFNIAKEWNYTKKNPFNNISLGRIKVENWYDISFEEFKKILSAIDNRQIRKRFAKDDADTKIRMRGLLGIMFGTGLRLAEALNLLWSNGNIDWKNNQIHIINRPGTQEIPAFYIKDYEVRSVPAPGWVMEMLKECKAIAETGNPFVFLSRDRYETVKKKWQKVLKEGREKEWRSPDLLNNYLRSFKKACRTAGIVTTDRLMIHCLRKSYGTNLVNLGTPPSTVQALLGHGSVSTTMKYYTKACDANKKLAVEGLERMMGEGG